MVDGKASPDPLRSVQFGEKPFVWEFLLGGDASKSEYGGKTIYTENPPGDPQLPQYRVSDLVCKISFASRSFLVAVAKPLIFFVGFRTDGDLSFAGVTQGQKRGCIG